MINLDKIRELHRKADVLIVNDKPGLHPYERPVHAFSGHELAQLIHLAKQGMPIVGAGESRQLIDRYEGIAANLVKGNSDASIALTGENVKELLYLAERGLCRYGLCDDCGEPYTFDPTDGGTICVKCLRDRCRRLVSEIEYLELKQREMGYVNSKTD